jgi:CheY-like chemotaxis protein
VYIFTGDMGLEGAAVVVRKTSGPILIVEDDFGLRLDTRELLEEAGFQVADAGDGRKALRRLADEEQPLPALILLDLSMPFMDGWDFVAILRENPRLARLPVVLLSANQPDAAILSTVAAYLKKPVDPSELLATVKALLLAQVIIDG